MKKPAISVFPRHTLLDFEQKWSNLLQIIFENICIYFHLVTLLIMIHFTKESNIVQILETSQTTTPQFMGVLIGCCALK